MNRQTLILITFQILNLLVSFFTTFYIASNLTSDLYAVIAVGHLLTMITVSFSFLGLESYLSRNLIFWLYSNRRKYAQIVTTNALFYRLITSLLIQFPLFFYSWYIDSSKFNSNYLFFFVVFGLTSTLSSFVDTLNNILRARNQFILASFYLFLSSVTNKFLTLFFFIEYGFDTYIYSLALAPILLLFFQYKTIVTSFSWTSIISISSFYKLIKKRRYLLFSNYSSFLFNYIDNFFISLFVQANIIGSYSLMKQFYIIGKTILDNCFDPLLIHLIRLRNNWSQSLSVYKRSNKYVKIFVAILLLFMPILIFTIDNILILLGIIHYSNIKVYLLLCYIAMIPYLFFKIPFYIASVLDSEKSSFKIYTVMASINTIVSFISFIALPTQLLPLLLSLCSVFAIIYMLRYRKYSSYYKFLLR